MSDNHVVINGDGNGSNHNKSSNNGKNNGNVSGDRSLRSSHSRTFASQNDLPRLPIPSLEETLSKFPKVLKALQTPEQQSETLDIVQTFLKGDGPRLQQLLEQYEQDGVANGTVGSYVEEFWNDSYLAPDQSVVLNLNPFFVLEEGPDRKTATDQIRRAASLTFASIKLASLVSTEEMEPDVHRGIPLDMDQYKMLFGCCRLPHCGTTDAVAAHPESSHVVVLCRSQLYYFQALWPEDDYAVAVDESDIVDILRAIVTDSRDTPLSQAGQSALGVLTSLPRGDWAKARENMVKCSPKTAASLRIVDSALFVLVLDDYVPCDINETASNMLHGTYKLKPDENGVDYQIGTCSNRWYDKLQVIVCTDGTSGINFEHSAVDGHTALRFVSDVFAETIVNFAQSITKLIHGQGRIPHVVEAEVKRAACVTDDACRPILDVFPKKLVFELPGSVLKQIYFAETALGDQIVATDTVVLEFKEYGKNLVKANNLSPDSFVQMSMLLAYYRLYGKIVCTYEPVLTKQFYHGRTEAMRTATPEAAEFCKIFTDMHSTNDEKLAALRKATKEHSRLVSESATGKGVDRHLFALKCIAERNDVPVPSFFDSRPWKTLNHTILSTSNCGNPALRLFGFGPVVQDGFGIGYIIRDHGLQYSVSSKHRQTTRYVNTLQATLIELKELLKPVSDVKVRGYHRPHLSAVQEHITDNAYEDFWGETSIEISPSEKKPPKRPQLERLDSFSKYFASVVRRDSVPREVLAQVGESVDLHHQSNEESD